MTERIKTFKPMDEKGRVCEQDNNLMKVVQLFVAKRYGFGLTEAEICEELKIGDGNKTVALRYVRELVQEGFVKFFISQESTAGPFAGRYKLADNLVVEVKLIIKE